MVRINTKRKSINMKKIPSWVFFLIIFFINFNSSLSNEVDIYKKIDTFSEVLEKINK